MADRNFNLMIRQLHVCRCRFYPLPPPFFSTCYEVFASSSFSCQCSTWSPRLHPRCFFVLSSECIIPGVPLSACASSVTASPVSGRIKSPMTTDWTFTRTWRGRGSSSSYTGLASSVLLLRLRPLFYVIQAAFVPCHSLFNGVRDPELYFLRSPVLLRVIIELNLSYLKIEVLLYLFVMAARFVVALLLASLSFGRAQNVVLLNLLSVSIQQAMDYRLLLTFLIEAGYPRTDFLCQYLRQSSYGARLHLFHPQQPRCTKLPDRTIHLQ